MLNIGALKRLGGGGIFRKSVRSRRGSGDSSVSTGGKKKGKSFTFYP